MPEFINKKILNLVRVCMFVAAIPIFFFILKKGFEFSSISAQLVFWLIDCFPLYYLWNHFYKPNYISDLNDPKYFGIIIALIGFLATHLIFYSAVYYALIGDGRGKSTTGIIFIFLPFLTIIVMSFCYFIGFHLKETKR